MKHRFAQCFLGKAATWHEQSLSDADRMAYTSAPIMEAWYDALRERFSMPVTEARGVYNKLACTLYDVYDRKDPDEFLQKIVVYSQEACEATTEQAQAQAAYNKPCALSTAHVSASDKPDDYHGIRQQVNARKSQWFS
ncbi:hypothetical protein PMG11_05167 [Penicillium brasilianum]|uniref:Uncharacterized protein n=1 Tax=Penicillium brasilianum TaxID=104259 RepID=A0A0F7VEZ3_PENBI|nr:hypothetical protein PMG11_05167 [Penicillium brasilianum]